MRNRTGFWCLMTILLLAALTIPLVSCGGDDDDDDDDDTGDDDTDDDDDDSSAHPGEGQALFAEIMYDPFALEDGMAEWVELRNLADTEFNLNGCVFGDQNHETKIEVDLALPAGGYLILGIGEGGTNQSPAAPDWEWGVYNLSNGDDAVSLTCSGVLIDTVIYDELSMAYDPIKGASLSLCPGSDDATANDDMSNWIFSTSAMSDGDMGTPRQANDACE